MWWWTHQGYHVDVYDMSCIGKLRLSPTSSLAVPYQTGNLVPPAAPPW
jgi:hypothetical protein